MADHHITVSKKSYDRLDKLYQDAKPGQTIKLENGVELVPRYVKYVLEYMEDQLGLPRKKREDTK